MTRIYDRRAAAFKKARAEWQKRQAALPDGHPHKGAPDSRMLDLGYLLVLEEKDPAKRQALKEWLSFALSDPARAAPSDMPA